MYEAQLQDDPTPIDVEDLQRMRCLRLFLAWNKGISDAQALAYWRCLGDGFDAVRAGA